MADVTLCTDKTAWDGAVNALGGHPLQLWGWGEVKAKHRWSVERILVTDAAGEVIGACQILLRQVPGLGEAILYAPRGPVWAEGRGDEVMDAVIAYVRRSKRGLVFTVEPAGTELPRRSEFRQARETILMSHTLMIDLTLGEQQILANMMKNHRYYIRKAIKDPSIEIRRVTDPAELTPVMDVYRSTAERDAFGLHPDEYYADIMRELGDDSVLFVAYQDDAPIAFVWDAVSDDTAFELYGGMNDAGRKSRINYPLKWAAITHALERGVKHYDMNGLLNDGISSFKQGFAHDHEADDLVGTWDLPLSPLYVAYRDGVPLLREGRRVLARVRRDGLRTSYRELVAPRLKRARALTTTPFRTPNPTIKTPEPDSDAT